MIGIIVIINIIKEDFEKVNNRIKNLEHKITKINEELDKSKQLLY